MGVETENNTQHGVDKTENTVRLNSKVLTTKHLLVVLISLLVVFVIGGIIFVTAGQEYYEYSNILIFVTAIYLLTAIIYISMAKTEVETVVDKKKKIFTLKYNWLVGRKTTTIIKFDEITDLIGCVYRLRYTAIGYGIRIVAGNKTFPVYYSETEENSEILAKELRQIINYDFNKSQMSIVKTPDKCDKHKLHLDYLVSLKESVILYVLIIAITITFLLGFYVAIVKESMVLIQGLAIFLIVLGIIIYFVFSSDFTCEYIVDAEDQHLSINNKWLFYKSSKKVDISKIQKIEISRQEDILYDYYCLNLYLTRYKKLAIKFRYREYAEEIKQEIQELLKK